MSRIEKQDTQGTKPLLSAGELGYDNYTAGGDVGRVYVGTGTENVAIAKKSEVTALDNKTNAHIAKVDNPHSVTKAQVGLGNADNTADVDKSVLSATRLTTPRSITISGDVSGSVSFDGSTNVNISTTVQPNSVALGVDTTGNYVSSVVAGSGVTVTGVVGEGWTPSIAITPVGTSGTYTKVQTNDKGQVVSGDTLTANDIPNLDASKITSGIIDAARLPAYVDDVLEYANLSVFPAVGEAGKIYVALDTNKAYRWSGSTYVYITSGAVDSVAGKTGVVTLVKADVGLANVDNTSDINKPISTATQNALNTKVDTSTNQTINGIKTFSSNPISTATQNTAVNALTRKDYVDGLNASNVKQSANLSDLTSAEAARTNLGLGTAATRNVGTGAGHVMEVGAFGLGYANHVVDFTKRIDSGFYLSTNGSVGMPSGMVSDGGWMINTNWQYNRVGNRYNCSFYGNVQNNFIGYRRIDLNGVPQAPVEIHHTGNLLGSTGSSTSFPMSQKSVTDALNTKVGLSGDETIAGVKTFSSNPIVPTPTTGTQAVNKNYADTKVTKIGSTDNAIVRFNGTTGEVQNSNAIIDDNGNVGIGVIPSGNYRVETPNNYLGAFRFGSLCGGSSGANFASVGYNFRTTATSNIYLYDLNNSSSMIRFDSGGFNFLTAPTGTPGNNISYTQAMTLNSTGNLLLTSGTGALGYGAGAGGTVTQLTSKSTAVTLNKPSGRINTHNSALAAGETVYFQLNNSLLSVGDGVILTNTSYGVFLIRAGLVIDGVAYIYITNTGVTSLSHVITIQFQIIKGSNA